MKKYRNIVLSIFVFLASIVIFGLSFYNYEISPVSDNKDEKEVVIKSGSSVKEIANTLEQKHLIRNKFFFRLYIKIMNKNNLKASTYKLNETMNVKQIVEVLENGNAYNKDTIKITFKEGKNMRYIASTIRENTSNSEDAIYDLLKDKTYINELIGEYWFLSDEITNNKIYYSLEGYLFPDTYSFNSKKVSVKEIFKTMLDEMDKKLTPYKNQIESSNLSIHKIITLSSVVELEGANATDRASVAGVFYNRLNDKWSLGSDATTYYASKIDDWTISLTYKELDDCSNSYNTRCKSYSGLPVGPIANPSIESIKAVINPEKHNYYYFVADCKGKVYLNQNEMGHNITINKLKADDNWCA